MSWGWPALQPGDRVRIVSPASWPEGDEVVDLVTVLGSWGFEAEIAEHAETRHGYMAGTDQQRLADLNAAIADPGVRAIVATRGGAGAYRIAPSVDAAALRRDPKPIVGFSDISYLHLAALHGAGVGGIHGCLVGANAQRSARQLLTTDEPLTVHADATAVSAGATTSGRASGRLLGGNLFAVAGSVGVGLPAFDGAILFLEDLRKHGLGVVDRQLTQLLASGTLEGVAGVVLGSFEQFDSLRDRGWSLLDVFADRLGSLGVPILGGLPCGHALSGDDGLPDQMCLPIGATVEIDAETGVLTCRP